MTNIDNALLTDLGAALVAGNLTDRSLLAQSADTPNLHILPNANVIKVGGQSFSSALAQVRAAVMCLRLVLIRVCRPECWQRCQ